MRYTVDNDLHIHSRLSSCSNDPAQTTARILRYAQENGLKTVCLTDHFWDETLPGASSWYAPQDFAHISAAKPLPQAEGVRFLFGCETELDRFLTLGVSKERFSAFDFIVIPTTHFHMRGYTLSEEELQNAETRAIAWVKRLDAVLSMPLPFHKIGLAHLTCGLIAPTREEYREVLQHLPAAEMERLFKKAATLGVGCRHGCIHHHGIGRRRAGDIALFAGRRTDAWDQLPANLHAAAADGRCSASRLLYRRL